jgi:hypothetical protein
MRRIPIAIYPGLDDVDAAGPCKVLSNVIHAHTELEDEFVITHRPGGIVAGHRMRLSVPRR